ncbi:hypothetical protein [Pseudoalteromonas luteoviolacea]|uniref:Uncharacterized protein n=1 Tax=Pseudoalteromonas luteoviolacea H33 TaxID=1365251 RepID=A0A167E6Q4_9GAMM|nr:hypothetical protein [Pseudoalteromonas luteoviolacea]KZN50128.1 hypothetical protein N476_17425 [Pseudoalteromonas luteoviolacea H33]KZN76299.1 hypothetical protein N477_16465 [Pseudoalteromonas luteoviolacea H33-S]MBQ4877693.1 hypothetical protein [Pseudoalteromonas luteoviolacea]MBQ4906861.1 hypothetical protein [Pseudoalteromonas luteoviolacea]
MYLKSILFLVIALWFGELDAHESKSNPEAMISSTVDTQAFEFYTMLGKGNRWHIAYHVNRRLAVHILSALNARGDRSLYGFQAEDIDGMALVSTQIYDVFMNGNGNGWYECASGFVVTGMYFYDEGDRSVERFECTRVLGKTTYPMFDYQNADINGPVVCGKMHGKDTYTTGFYYQDTGDDRIRYMQCGYFY